MNQVHHFLDAYWGNEVRCSCRTWSLISYSLHCSELCFQLYLCSKTQWVLKSLSQCRKSRSCNTAVWAIRVRCSRLSRFLFWRSPVQPLMCQPGKWLSQLYSWLSEMFSPPNEIRLNLDLTMSVALRENVMEHFGMGKDGVWNWDLIIDSWIFTGHCLCGFPVHVTLQTERSDSPCCAWLCSCVMALLHEAAGDVKIALLTHIQLMIAEKHRSGVRLEHLVLLSHYQQQMESKVKKHGGSTCIFFSAFVFFLFLFVGSGISYSMEVQPFLTPVLFARVICPMFL